MAICTSLHIRKGMSVRAKSSEGAHWVTVTQGNDGSGVTIFVPTVETRDEILKAISAALDIVDLEKSRECEEASL